MFCDCVSQIAADENSISATSVTMKAGMRKRAMKQAVEEADQRAGGEHDEHRDRDGGAVAGKDAAVLVDQAAPQRAAAEQRVIDGRRHDDRAGDADEPHDGALRQVDAGDDDDECLADRDGQQRPDVGELVAEMLRALARSGKKTAIDDEIGDRQIEDEILGKQQAAREPASPPSAAACRPPSRPPAMPRSRTGSSATSRFPRATAS